MRQRGRAACYGDMPGGWARFALRYQAVTAAAPILLPGTKDRVAPGGEAMVNSIEVGSASPESRPVAGNGRVAPGAASA